jgi:origin recognition complex subunit 5
VPPLAKEETIAYIVSLFPSPPAKSGSINYYHPSLQPLYGQFVESLYSVCALSTTDPGELAYIAAARWPGFVNPLLEDWRVERSRRVEAKRSLNLDETMEIDELDSNDHDEEIDREPYALPSPDEHLRLLRLFSSTFTTAASALIPRTSDARTWALENAPPSTLRLSQPFGAASDPSIKRTAVTTQNVGIDGLGLGRKTKTLIVAAFVASFNPARTDVRMFVRADAIGKKKKKRGGPRKMKPGAVAKVGLGISLANQRADISSVQLPQRLVGPQAFSLERLVNIFGSILAEEDRDEPDFLRAEVSRVHFLSTVRLSFPSLILPISNNPS